MSLSRYTEDPEWFGPNPPGYVYVTDGPMGSEFNVPIRAPVHFCELAMRALAQSGELDDETLRACQRAFAERFDYVDMEPITEADDA